MYIAVRVFNLMKQTISISSSTKMDNKFPNNFSHLVCNFLYNFWFVCRIAGKVIEKYINYSFGMFDYVFVISTVYNFHS